MKLRTGEAAAIAAKIESGGGLPVRIFQTPGGHHSTSGTAENRAKGFWLLDGRQPRRVPRAVSWGVGKCVKPRGKHLSFVSYCIMIYHAAPRKSDGVWTWRCVSRVGVGFSPRVAKEKARALAAEINADYTSVRHGSPVDLEDLREFGWEVPA